MLIDEKGQACLTDFGLSSMMKIGSRSSEYLRQEKQQPGALSWLAPELFKVGEDSMPSSSSDIYSYGCIMYEVSLLIVQQIEADYIRSWPLGSFGSHALGEY